MNKRRLVLYCLFTGLLTFLLVEGMLRLIDPWGVWTGYQDTRAFVNHLVADPELSYVLPPGKIDLSHSEITILEDGTRAVPATNPDGKDTLVFVGDSVTFNAAMSDGETWVNLVARRLPDTHVIAASLPGYNSQQVRRLVQSFPEADRIIYLVISNDPEGEWDYTFALNGSWAIIDYYRYFKWRFSFPEGVQHWARFFEDMDAISADSRVILVAFDDNFGTLLAQRYPVQLIPHYQHVVSLYDPHPSAEGNREIAAAMLPIVQQAVAAVGAE